MVKVRVRGGLSIFNQLRKQWTRKLCIKILSLRLLTALHYSENGIQMREKEISYLFVNLHEV